MATCRDVALPEELLSEVDALVGPAGRNSFVADCVTAELKRRRLISFLEDPANVWKDEDYPELAALGTEAWVDKLREADAERARVIEAAHR